MEKIFVVLNPTSGRGSGGRALEAIRWTMQQAGLPFDLYETTRTQEAIEVAREARLHGYRLVAAAGGDGTIHEVVNGLAQAAPIGAPVGPLAILPVGTGNDFASMVGTPLKLLDATHAIRAGRIRRIDLCHAQIRTADTTISRYFDNNLGVGFEAQVTVESRKITRLRGFSIYLMAVFKALHNYTVPRFQVYWSAGARTYRVEQQSLMVSIGNSRRTGGGFYVTPDAEVDDGLLDVGIARAISTPQILALLPRVMMGTHRNHHAIRLVRCGSVSVVSDQPVPIHADGEILTDCARALSVTLEPKRLEVIV